MLVLQGVLAVKVSRSCDEKLVSLLDREPSFTCTTLFAANSRSRSKQHSKSSMRIKETPPATVYKASCALSGSWKKFDMVPEHLQKVYSPHVLAAASLLRLAHILSIKQSKAT